MLNNDDLLKIILADTAKKVVEIMDEDARKEIIAAAIKKVLLERDFQWEISSILHDEAKDYAKIYVKKPEVQEKIKQKVIEGVEKVMNGLANAVATDVQGTIKSKYCDWLEEK